MITRSWYVRFYYTDEFGTYTQYSYDLDTNRDYDRLQLHRFGGDVLRTAYAAAFAGTVGEPGFKNCRITVRENSDE